MAAGVFPRRFRLRLTVAFVLVAGVAAGAVAAGTYVAIRAYRLEAVAARAREVTELNLELAPQNLDRARLDFLLDVYRRRGGFETAVVTEAGAASSDPALTVAAVPDAVRQGVAQDGRGEGTVEVGGTSYLVTGGHVPDAPADFYFFFPRDEVFAGLRELAAVAAASWLAVTGGAAVVGDLVARRTLRPVRAASAAAGALAEGLLDTRLSVGRRDEFGEWATWFNRMADALEEKISALSAATERERRFTADVAHELRTPLASMVTAASLVEERLPDLPPAARRPVELLIADTRRLRRLVAALLELSRLDAGHDPVELDAVDLHALVAGVIRAVRLDDRVVNEVAPLTIATSDTYRLERVLANLVGNAVEHGAPPVVVTAVVADGDVTIEVRDHGPGIPEDVVPRLFDRFAKGDRARSGGGAGLGLAIAHEHVRALGGSIEARNHPTGGASFSIRLPRDPVGSNGAAADRTGAVTAGRTVASGRGEPRPA